MIKYDLFDIFNVPPHRRLGAFRIVALDCSQNSAVTRQRFLRATFHLQRAFPRVALLPEARATL